MRVSLLELYDFILIVIFWAVAFTSPAGNYLLIIASACRLLWTFKTQ